MKKLSLMLLSFAASTALGNINFQVSGASNVVSAGGYNAVYYSNISESDNEGNYFKWSKDGNSCNRALNFNCKTAKSLLTFNASSTSPTSGSPQFWIVASGDGRAPASGESIFVYNIVSHFPYQSPNNYVSAVNTFASICSKLTSYGLDSHCNPTATAEPYSPVAIQMYIIADANGNGILDGGEDILGFSFIVDSSIPKVSSAAEQIGIWSYKLGGGDHSVHIQSVGMESTWPSSDNGLVGAQFLRFYYDYADIGSSYNPLIFTTLDPLKNPLTKFYDVAVNTDGTLDREYFSPATKGAPYYFRTAIVDMAGNVGFFNTDDSKDHMAIPY